MSDSTEINGVKISHVGGGYYELNHSSLADPERVQGKEKAEARAREISPDGGEDGNGEMAPQGNLGATTTDSLNQNANQGDQEASKGPSQKDESEKDKHIAELEAQLKQSEGRTAEVEKALEKIEAQVTTVTVTEGDNEGQVPAGAPRRYEGTMDAKTKKALEKAGFKTRRIVLEENENIPPTGLFVGHNGRGYMIQPGEPVDVPEFLLEVLDNAVQSTPVVDSKSNRVLGYRDRSRYPYREVRAKDDD